MTYDELYQEIQSTQAPMLLSSISDNKKYSNFKSITLTRGGTDGRSEISLDSTYISTRLIAKNEFNTSLLDYISSELDLGFAVKVSLYLTSRKIVIVTDRHRVYYSPDEETFELRLKANPTTRKIKKKYIEKISILIKALFSDTCVKVIEKQNQEVFDLSKYPHEVVVMKNRSIDLEYILNTPISTTDAIDYRRREIARHMRVSNDRLGYREHTINPLFPSEYDNLCADILIPDTTEATDTGRRLVFRLPPGIYPNNENSN